MAKRMMELNPNSFRKLVATFLEANGRVSFLLLFFPLAVPALVPRPGQRRARAHANPPRVSLTNHQ